MREIKEVLRQRYGLKLSQQAIADSRGLPRSTIRDYLSRASRAGLTWPLPDDIDNDALNARLFPSGANRASTQCPYPDWAEVHRELKRKGVTPQLLWEEYKENNPKGYQYSWYTQHYRDWLKEKDVWMVQSHPAGEKTFVDYSGLTIPIWKTNLTQIDYCAEVFVSTLGASDLIFCHASKSQQLEDWITSHNQMFHCNPYRVSPTVLPAGIKKPSMAVITYRPRRITTVCPISMCVRKLISG